MGLNYQMTGTNCTFCTGRLLVQKTNFQFAQFENFMSAALQLNGCEIQSLLRCKDVFLLKLFCLRRRRFKFCQFWNSLQIQSSELVHNLHIHHHCKLKLPRAHVSAVKIFLVNPKPPHELNPKKQDLRWREMFPEDWKNLVRQLIPERLNITEVILHIKGWPATKMVLDGDLSNTSLQKN